MQKARNIKQLPVDLKAIKDGLSSLLLPSQKPLFSQTMYVVYHVVIYNVYYIYIFVLSVHYLHEDARFLFFFSEEIKKAKKSSDKNKVKQTKASKRN